MHYYLKNLGDLRPLELTEAFQNIPVDVTTLSLRGNKLHQIFVGDLVVLLKKLPKSVRTLDLSMNSLKLLLVKILPAIPRSVTSVNLGWNYLYTLSADELAAVFSSIPAHIKSLDLNMNLLNTAGVPSLVKALKALPPNVNSLNLSENNLYSLFDEGFITVLTALPETVTSLNLSCNEMFLASDADLAKVFAVLPESVVNLDLSGNNLKELPIVHLVSLFKALRGVTSLNLSGNGFSNIAEEDLTLILVSLPVTVKTVFLDDTIINLNEVRSKRISPPKAKIVTDQELQLGLYGGSFFKTKIVSEDELAKLADDLDELLDETGSLELSSVELSSAEF